MSTCFAVGTQRKEKSEMAEYMVIRLIMAGSIIGLLLLLCGVKKLIHMAISHTKRSREVSHIQ